MATTAQSAEKFLDLIVGRTRYLEAGAGEPLILLHGMGQANSANSFDTVIPGLAQQFHVYALDQLGFGKGTREVAEGPTFELIMEQIREFMDRLGIPQACVAGHSMGGWMAAHLAYQSPNRVKKLAMLNAAGLNVGASAGVKPMDAVPSVEQLAGLIREGMVNKGKEMDPVVAHYAQVQHDMLSQPNAAHSLDPLLHLMLTPDLRTRYMLQQRLSHIAMPTLVLWGTGDVMDPYPTWSKEYDKLKGDMSKSSKPWVIPGARYVLVDTGHYTQWEMPEYTVNLLTEFFKG